jgi:hypothetical protein
MNSFPDVSFFPRAAKALTSYRPYWAKRFGTAPFLPMSRAEMEQLGWDSCDVILVTGDAYVDHPSFGMAVIGRVLEAQGFRVGIIAQPDWQSAEPFKALAARGKKETSGKEFMGFRCDNPRLSRKWAMSGRRGPRCA